MGVKRTKLEEMLDEKRQEVSSLGPPDPTLETVAARTFYTERRRFVRTPVRVRRGASAGPVGGEGISLLRVCNWRSASYQSTSADPTGRPRSSQIW